jgi:hypothetical protein
MDKQATRFNDSDLLALQPCDAREYCCWDTRRAELAPLAEPILASDAFNRLGSITFLGILSPRFADVVDAPLYARRPRPLLCDGSRLSHCLGVALVALEMARSLNFSERSQRYAVAWGLLHDIGNWPLSHTGEFAFSRITGHSTRDLRRQILTGNKMLPSALHLRRELKNSGLDPDIVIAFLDGTTAQLPAEVIQLRSLLKSALSPDSLEGMWRAGRVFGISVSHPKEFSGSFLLDLFNDIQLDRDRSRQAIHFWRQRRCIFQRFINRPSTVRWESAWSQAILRRFNGVGLIDSLYLSEDMIISEVLGAEKIKQASLSRYKHPIEYVIEPKRRRTLSAHASLEELARILTERQLTLNYGDFRHVAS